MDSIITTILNFIALVMNTIMLKAFCLLWTYQKSFCTTNDKLRQITLKKLKPLSLSGRNVYFSYRLHWNLFLKYFCCGKSPFLWSHWYSLFRTSVDSAHGFQSQGGSIIAHSCLRIMILRVNSEFLSLDLSQFFTLVRRGFRKYYFLESMWKSNKELR